MALPNSNALYKPIMYDKKSANHKAIKLLYLTKCNSQLEFSFIITVVLYSTSTDSLLRNAPSPNQAKQDSLKANFSKVKNYNLKAIINVKHYNLKEISKVKQDNRRECRTIEMQFSRSNRTI